MTIATAMPISKRITSVCLMACVTASLISCGTPEAPIRDAGTIETSVRDSVSEANRQIVLAFYRRALVEQHPREAFEQYMTPKFVHKPDVSNGTRTATITFLEELIAGMPQPRWEILRTIAEHDLVFVHAKFTPAEGAPPYAIADIFRLQDGKIVEHWDVVAGPPSDSRNPNPRF